MVNQLLASGGKWLRHGSSTKPLLSHCKGDNTSKKNLFFENINLLCNSVHLERQNDVKFNMKYKY